VEVSLAGFSLVLDQGHPSFREVGESIGARYMVLKV